MLSQLGTWACIWLLPDAVKEPCSLTCFLTCYWTLSRSHDLTVMWHIISCDSKCHPMWHVTMRLNYIVKVLQFSVPLLYTELAWDLGVHLVTSPCCQGTSLSHLFLTCYWTLSRSHDPTVMWYVISCDLKCHLMWHVTVRPNYLRKADYFTIW